MIPLSPAALLQQGKSVRELIALLRAVLTGETPREVIVDFTRRLWPNARDQGGPFHANGAASTVFESLWNVMDRDASAFFIRDCDLACYVKWLTEGSPPLLGHSIAWCRLTAPQIATLLEVPTVRYWVDGLGPRESAVFASPATGRRFEATSSWQSGEVSEAGIDTGAPGSCPAILDDLFDTLTIDFDDLTWTDETRQVEWQLWRQDDNGNRVRIRAFTGLAKATAALASFERLAHKQTYWIEEAVANQGVTSRGPRTMSKSRWRFPRVVAAIVGSRSRAPGELRPQRPNPSSDLLEADGVHGAGLLVERRGTVQILPSRTETVALSFSRVTSHSSF